MTWTLDNSAQAATTTNNPATLSFTCGSGADLLVVVLFVDGTTARTGGAPSYNSEDLTDSGEGFVYFSGGECGVEIWYLAPPSIGGYTISVPNDGSLTIGISAMSFTSSLGTAAKHASNSATGETEDPSVVVATTVANCLMIGGLGSGDRDAPAAGANYTLVHTEDIGNQTWGSEYDLDSGSSGDITVDFDTARADDWGLIGMAFEEVEVSVTIPRHPAHYDGLTVI